MATCSSGNKLASISAIRLKNIEEGKAESMGGEEVGTAGLALRGRASLRKGNKQNMITIKT